MTTTTNRRDLDATTTVYRNDYYCGMVFRPTPGGRTDYLASPWTDAVEQRTFDNEDAAVEYLVLKA